MLKYLTSKVTELRIRLKFLLLGLLGKQCPGLTDVAADTFINKLKDNMAQSIEESLEAGEELDVDVAIKKLQSNPIIADMLNTVGVTWDEISQLLRNEVFLARHRIKSRRGGL